MVNRINLILQAKNITARQFAEEIGIQPSGMSHILSGRNNPSLDFVMKVIRRYPEIDINWLMFGKGEMYETDNRHTSAAQPTPAFSPSNIIPAQATPIAEAPSLVHTTIGDYRTPIPTGASSNIQSQQPSYPSKKDSHVEPDLFSMQEVAPVNTSTPTPQFVQKTAEESSLVQGCAQGSTVQQGVAAYNQPSEKKSTSESIAKPAENSINEIAQAVALAHTNLGKKKMVKLVIIYDDHSFAEYYPE